MKKWFLTDLGEIIDLSYFNSITINSEMEVHAEILENGLFFKLAEFKDMDVCKSYVKCIYLYLEGKNESK